jgi:hypothetical protein
VKANSAGSTCKNFFLKRNLPKTAPVRARNV